jgi:hypothetical protein
MEFASATNTHRKSGEAPNSTPNSSRMKRGFFPDFLWDLLEMEMTA